MKRRRAIRGSCRGCCRQCGLVSAGLGVVCNSRTSSIGLAGRCCFYSGEGSSINVLVGPTQIKWWNVRIVWSESVVERFEERFNHPVQFIVADLLVCGVFSKGCSRLLPPGTSFQRCFLEEKFFEVVGRVKVGLLARRYEDGRDLLLLQNLKVNRPEERVVCKRLKAGSSDTLVDVLFQKRADGVKTRHRNRGLGDRIRRIGLANLLLELVMVMRLEWSLQGVSKRFRLENIMYSPCCICTRRRLRQETTSRLHQDTLCLRTLPAQGRRVCRTCCVKAYRA